MKTISSTYRYIIATGLFLSTAIINFAQNANESKGQFSKSYEINTDGELSFKCNSGDLKINTWNKNVVKVTGEIVVYGKNAEDRKTTIEVFKDIDVTGSANSLDINTHFCSGSWNIALIKRYKLKNNMFVNIRSYVTTYTLWIPESLDLDLHCKYNKVVGPDLLGNLNIKIYSGTLVIGNIGDDYNFDLKYTNAKIGSGGSGVFDMYDCELETGKLGDLEIDTKYTEIEIESADKIDLDSYDDEIELGNVGTLDANAKYTNFEITGDIKSCKLSFYDSDIDAKNINKLSFDAKYSTIDAEKVGAFKSYSLYDNVIELVDVGSFICEESKYDEFYIENSAKSIEITYVYDSDFKIGKVGSLRCDQSKYDNFRIKKATGSIIFKEVYDTDVSVDYVSSEFTSFQGYFKYCAITLDIDPDLEFKLEYDVKYGDLRYPEERFKGMTTRIEKDSYTQFKGSTKEGAKCEMIFSGYDSDLSIY